MMSFPNVRLLNEFFDKTRRVVFFENGSDFGHLQLDKIQVKL